MLIAFILLSLAIFQQTVASDALKYEGFHVTMSALTFNRDILFSILSSTNRMKNHIFANLSESEPTGVQLIITNIQIKSSEVKEDKFQMNRFDFKTPIYMLKGEGKSIYFKMTFDIQLKW